MAVVLSAFAASAQKTATATPESFTKGKSAGVFTFTLPADITAEKVNQSRNYYTQYFTVNFDEAKHIVTISLAKNEEMNKQVINRFMTSLDIRSFKIADKDYTFRTMFDEYMK